MAVSLILLHIEGAPGEATIGGNRENDIVVDSFSWSLEAKVQDAKPKGSSGVDGKVLNLDAKALNIKKQFDSASTVLHGMMKTDKAFVATLRFIDPANRGSRTASGKIEIDSVLEIKLEGCRIDRISLSASGSGKSISLSETVVISFASKATLSYFPFDRKTKVRSVASEAVISPSDSSGR